MQVLSWGTKRLEVLEVDDDEVERLVTVEFPGLTRKRSPEDMYSAFAAWVKSSSREYDNHSLTCSQRAPDDQLGRRSFLRVVNHITKSQRIRKSAVDYVMGTVIYETFSLLRRIVQERVLDMAVHSRLLRALDAAEQYARFNYISGHEGSSEGDAFHDRSFALSPPVQNIQCRQAACPQCMAPFQVLQEAK